MVTVINTSPTNPIDITLVQSSALACKNVRQLPLF
jgi:hypothetical protein